MPIGTPALACAALLLEGVAGYPPALFARFRHPVVWMGWLLDRLDRRLNQPDWRFATRRAAGIVAVAVLLTATAAVTLPVAALGRATPAGWLVGVVLAASLPAQRSLDSHVRAVADALDRDGLAGGRRAVAMIVGRDTAVLDQAGVARAAIESLAENFADGVVAPAFWLALGGLPGGALYKAVNTADSMIGHRSERYRAFGWAAARLDDLVNLPASRLAAFWIVLAAAINRADAGAAMRAVWRDAGHHRSPNAGWPEAAMAGALDLALSGPRVYGSIRVDDRFIGGTRQAATSADIRRALSLYRAACLIQLAALAALAIAAAVV